MPSAHKLNLTFCLSLDQGQATHGEASISRRRRDVSEVTSPEAQDRDGGETAKPDSGYLTSEGVGEQDFTQAAAGMLYTPGTGFDHLDNPSLSVPGPDTQSIEPQPSWNFGNSHLSAIPGNADVGENKDFLSKTIEVKGTPKKRFQISATGLRPRMRNRPIQMSLRQYIGSVPGGLAFKRHEYDPKLESRLPGYQRISIQSRLRGLRELKVRAGSDPKGLHRFVPRSMLLVC